MSEIKPLTQKQRYLQFLIPKLDDIQIEKMIAAVNSTAAAKPPTITVCDAACEKNKVNPQTETPSTEVKRKPVANPNPKNAVKDPYRDMMGMIGCEDAKKQLTAMIADFRMRKLAAARGRNSARAYYHAVFTGNPGSAKTTCARLYAKVLAQEGITKTDRLAELSRSKIVDKYVGSNPGLRSRIPYAVAFSDYTTEELVAISRIIAGEQGYEIAESAVRKLSAIYDCARNQKDFGNGRYARNVVEAAVRAKGIRLGVMEKELDDLMDQTRYSDSMLFSLDETCFDLAPEPPEKPRRRIGFCA